MMVDQRPNPVVVQLSALLEQLSDEKINDARQKIATHGWPEEMEGVNIATILERCREDRDLLSAGSESGYLNALPTTMISQARERIQAVLSNIQSVLQGNNIVPNLASTCDVLRAFVISNRLDRAEERVSALQMEQAVLTDLKAEVSRRARALAAALDKAGELDGLLSRSREAVTETTQARQSAHDQQQVAAGSSQQAAEALRITVQHRDSAEQANGKAQSSKNAVLAYEEDLKKLHDEGARFRQTIAEVQRRVEADLTKNRSDYEESIALAKEYESSIGAILQGAVSKDLFEAFDKRYREIEGKTRWWRGSLIAGLVCFAAASVWILMAAFPFSSVFYARLLLVPTFGFWIAFSAVEYGRERHLEEIYAFKSKISVSLEAYRGLVERVLASVGDLPQHDPRSKYADFVIGSVGNIFAPPANHTENGKPSGSTVSAVDVLEKVLRVVGERGN